MKRHLLKSLFITAFGLTGFAGSASAQATLVSDIQFNGNLIDAVGNSTVHLYNNLATFYSGDTLDWYADSVTANSNGGGVVLTIGDNVFTEDNYSIEVCFELGTTSGYRKIIDFLGLTADAGLYVNDQLRIYSGGNYGTTTLLPHTYYKLVMTRETATDTARAYLLNGNSLMLESKTVDVTGDYIATLSGNIRTLHFFHDDSSTVDEFSNTGRIERIRIWNGIVNATDLVSGVSENTFASSFDLYPNPVNDQLTIRFSQEENETVVLSFTDVAGRVLRSEQVKAMAGENVYRTSVMDLPKGMYLVNLRSSKGTVVSKLVIE